eukprot:9541365-Lingulodinium_polyedra.AAC.1
MGRPTMPQPNRRRNRPRCYLELIMTVGGQRVVWRWPRKNRLPRPSATELMGQRRASFAVTTSGSRDYHSVNANRSSAMPKRHKPNGQ